MIPRDDLLALANLKLASHRVDDAVTPEEYNTTLIALAMVARSYLRVLADAWTPQHRCSGCGHRWEEFNPHTGSTATGAELCGDCWRKAQPALHGLPGTGL